MIRQTLLLGACLTVGAGCGSDYDPPEFETTGVVPARLGDVYDLEVSLPHLPIAGASFAGVELEMTIELEDSGYGTIPARVTYGPARVDMRNAVVEDLTNGTIDVTVTPTSWTTGRIGPLRIDTTVFEIILDGEPADGGWSVSGRSWESLTALTSTFGGWRRHRFLVAGTDFFSGVGRVAEVALIKESEIRVRHGLELVSSDPVLRVTGGAVFAVNRLTFDNLQRLDPLESFSTSWQAGTGMGANPHDVLVISDDKGYVTRYEPPYDEVAIFDPGNGDLVGSISLGVAAENPDGTPRADHLVFADGSIFVGLQDIDRSFSRFEEGKLAVIDATLDELVDVIPLGGKNPGVIDVVKGADGRTRLYVALAGIFPGLQAQELSGGVVVVDAAGGFVERVALDDDVAAGNIAAMALASESLGYVVATDATFVNRILAFDPGQGTVLRTLSTVNDFIPELEVDSGGLLAIPDRSFLDPKLCLYRVPAIAGEAETFLGCGGLDLPPFSIESLD